jgi:hypothetical protein
MKIRILLVLFILTLQQSVLAEGARKSSSKHTAPISEFDLGRYQYCGNDNDCVVATNGCCDCANGGADVAVNKERLAAFRENFNCLNVACTEMAVEERCGTGVVTCVNHKCNYVKSTK